MAGTDTLGSLLASVTTTPAAGADWDSTIRPASDAPAMTLVVATFNDAMDGAIVKLLVLVAVPPGVVTETRPG